MTPPQANPDPTTKKFKYVWLVGLAVTLLIVAVPIVIFASPGEEQGSSPWDYVPEQAAHTDHANLMEGPYASGQEVTAACLECHSDAAAQVMDTVHWTWQADPVEVNWADELVSTGKANLLNNFCIGIQSNWQGCTSCHAGYGWDSADYFANATEDDVDCLVCHDQSGTYVKGSAGVPVEGVNLAVVAQSVGYPTRNNCGTCHFNGGGGDAVKHGDLDTTLTNPNEHIDVHMGGLAGLAAVVMVVGQPSPADHWASVAAEEEAALAAREVQVHPGEVLDLIYDPAVRVEMLDVRSETDYNYFHVIDSIHVPLADLESSVPDLQAQPDNTVFIVMSNDEEAATEAWRTLVSYSVPNVYILGGGVNAWIDTFNTGEPTIEPTPVATAGKDTLRYSFSAALGSRYQAAEPDPHKFDELEYEPHVELAIPRGPIGSGCGS